MSKVIFKSGDWVTYEDGAVEMINKSIRFGDTYYINHSLNSFEDIDRWIEHLERKTWWTLSLQGDAVRCMVKSLEAQQLTKYLI